MKSRVLVLLCAGIFLTAQNAATSGVEAPWAFNAPRAEGYSISLDAAEPTPGTPLLRGATVSFKVSVAYSLDISPSGAIVLVFQDEQNQSITGDREQTTLPVVKGSGIVTLADSVVVPVDANELRAFIPLVPDGLKTTTGEITLRYPITTSVTGPQYMPYPLARISIQQWEDFYDLVQETCGSSRRDFPNEHLEVFHTPDEHLHFAFTTTGHPAHPAWIARQVRDGSINQIGYFAGQEEPFAKLFRSYLSLTDKVLKRTQGEDVR